MQVNLRVRGIYKYNGQFSFINLFHSCENWVLSLFTLPACNMGATVVSVLFIWKLRVVIHPLLQKTSLLSRERNTWGGHSPSINIQVLKGLPIPSCSQLCSSVQIYYCSSRRGYVLIRALSINCHGLIKSFLSSELVAVIATLNNSGTINVIKYSISFNSIWNSCHIPDRPESWQSIIHYLIPKQNQVINNISSIVT